MDPRRKNSWDAFKPIGGRFEERPRPSRLSVWLGYLLALAVMLPLTLFVARFLSRFFRIFAWSGGSAYLIFVAVVGGGAAFALYHWARGIRDEIRTRQRLDHHRGRSVVPWKARPPEQDEEGSENRD